MTGNLIVDGLIAAITLDGLAKWTERIFARIVGPYAPWEYIPAVIAGISIVAYFVLERRARR